MPCNRKRPKHLLHPETEATETPTAESTSYAIMLPMRDTYPPVMLAEDDLVSDGYYTMCRDGKWGPDGKRRFRAAALPGG